ncbi:MAG: alpha/beta hydrolase [Methylocystis sp.]|nr:alpha/beta hydrolase [Methylocystis sp.]
MLELISTPDNPIPSGASVLGVRTRDGLMLRVAAFPCENAHGTIALLQGRAEFIEKYFETVEDLRRRGFHVVAMDWRGQGLSERELDEPRKGHVDDFAHYQRDLEALVETVLRPSWPQPWYALAHSMGAAILLEDAHDGQSAFQRLVLTAPMIDIHGVRFPRGARWLADTLDMIGLGAMLIPGGRLGSIVNEPFADNLLTSDPQRLARNQAILRAAPQLGIGDPTVGWVNAAFRQLQRFEAPEYMLRARTPMLVFSCGRDEIVSTPAIERFMQRVDLSTLINVPGARHELLMERDELRDVFWRAFDEFIRGRVA